MHFFQSSHIEEELKDSMEALESLCSKAGIDESTCRQLRTCGIRYREDLCKLRNVVYSNKIHQLLPETREALLGIAEWFEEHPKARVDEFNVDVFRESF